MESVRGKVRDRPLTTVSTTLALLPGLERFEILKSSNHLSRSNFYLLEDLRDGSAIQEE